MKSRRTGAALATVAALLVATGLAVPAQAAGCFGKQATIVGTNTKERIRGTSGRDVIDARGGNDNVRSGGGNDIICAGSGDDVVEAGPGRDVVDGQLGLDLLLGGPGRDRLIGGGRTDILDGGLGNDDLNAGQALDLLAGLGGNDRMVGGSGSDLLLPGSGNDRVDGGSEFDIVSFFLSPTGVTVDLLAGTAVGEGTDVLIGIEDIEGTPFNDVLGGNPLENLVWPHLGDDLVNGGDGNDIIIFEFSPAPVTVDLTANTSTGEGNDTLSSFEGSVGSFFGDSLSGNAFDNFLFGFEGDDTINGLDGDDLIVGSGGTDTADGGNHVTGDRCIETEVNTNCELFSATAPLNQSPSPGTGRLAAARELVARLRATR